MKNIPSCDGVRAVGMIMVMMFHFDILMCGWMGVQMFFVLSGYLITGILLESKTQPFGVYLRTFYTKRILRIFPIYFAYLFLLFFLYRSGYKIPLFQKSLGSLLTYTYNFSPLSAALHGQHHATTHFFSHFWSLCVEEHFYLLWPFAVYFLPVRTLKTSLIVLVIVIPFFRCWLAEHAFPDAVNMFVRGRAVYWFSLSHFDALALGAAMSLWKLEGKVSAALPILRTVLLIALITGGINLCFYPWSIKMITSLGFPTEGIAQYQAFWGYTLLNVLSAALICLFLNPQAKGAEGVNRFFSHPSFVQIGKMTYGMYVIHGFLLIQFQKWFSYEPYTLKAALLFPFYFCIVFICGWLSYRFYESPFLRLKNKFSYLPKSDLNK